MICYNIIHYIRGVAQMKACGLIVEYNPFHNGHLHHLKEAKALSGATVIIAIMSGNFLQRGEPAIIDKHFRTRAALNSGVDIVLELPYPYAVQSSELFAKGALRSLHELGVDSICFGSEIGSIEPFIQTVHTLNKSQNKYDNLVKYYMDQGYAFPQASNEAYKKIGISSLDVMQPNNILGLSYTKTIINEHLTIKPLTIKRINNDYHDETINDHIASATSIRKALHKDKQTKDITHTLPEATVQQLNEYKKTTTIWHHWEHYFPLLHYKVMTMESEQLATILGVDEGLENRIKQTARHAHSFAHWLDKIKTKRYTQTRLQRMFVHILTNTTKQAIKPFTNNNNIPYLRLLGMSDLGQAYINQRKKQFTVPLITNIKRDSPADITIDERATDAYYAVLDAHTRIKLRKQSFMGPIFKR